MLIILFIVIAFLFFFFHPSLLPNPTYFSFSTIFFLLSIVCWGFALGEMIGDRRKGLLINTASLAALIFPFVGVDLMRMKVGQRLGEDKHVILLKSFQTKFFKLLLLIVLFLISLPFLPPYAWDNAKIIFSTFFSILAATFFVFFLSYRRLLKILPLRGAKLIALKHTPPTLFSLIWLFMGCGFEMASLHYVIRAFVLTPVPLNLLLFLYPFTFSLASLFFQGLGIVETGLSLIFSSALFSFTPPIIGSILLWFIVVRIIIPVMVGAIVWRLVS